MNQRRSTKETSVMSNLWISSFLIALNVFFLKSVAFRLHAVSKNDRDRANVGKSRA